MKASKKEAKKKPGDLARARARHLRRQEIQDAISAVKRGQTAQVKIHGGMWELSPITPETECFPSKCLVRINGGRLQIGWVADKDGIKLVTGAAAVFHCSKANSLHAYARAVDEVAEKFC